ncbi:MAG: HEAT repeat domain-containing protein [Gemmatimonadetes bacterium]|nr:HEAT repeat domain-containing protein [Gemmatimonadota bacterium]
MSTRIPRASSLVAAALLAGAPAATAQSLASRVAAAPDGTVRFSFATRPGICGNGENGISRWSGRSSEWESDCEEGPARIALDVRDHRVAAMRTYVGGHWRPGGAGVTDLGSVRAADAAGYLLSLARSDDVVARRAIFAATLADSVTVWPDLLAIARDASRPQAVRKQATFWLGQEAAAAATRGLDELARDDDVDVEIRKQAIFALSQRPRDEGVPALIEIARRNGDPRLRRQALVWLGQSGDPRALALFEELLVKR